MNADEKRPAFWRRLFCKDGRLRGTLRLILYLPVAGIVTLGLMVPASAGAQLLASNPNLPIQSANVLIRGTWAVGILLSTWACRHLLDRRSWASLGFRVDRRAPGDVAWGLFMGAAVFAGIFVVEWAAGWLAVTSRSWETIGWDLVAVNLALSAVYYVSVGVMEEVVSRGYVLQALEDDWGTAVAVLVSSVAFGLFHGSNPHVTPLALFNLCIIGALLAYGYLVTRQLWLPIALHFSWNFFQGAVLGLPVSGMGRGDLWSTQVEGPDWVTGGAFGPEGGVLVLVGVVALWGLTWAWGRLRSVPGA